jgi:kumamolisin
MAVRVILRPRRLSARDPLREKVRRLATGAGLPPRLSPTEFARVQAPEPAALRDLLSYAAETDLEVQEVSALRHDVMLRGGSHQVAAAFGVDLELFDTPFGPRRSHRDEVHLPRRLQGSIVGVLGLDAVPRRRPAVLGDGRADGVVPRVFAERYRFPPTTGRGQRIAILSFGGGVHRRDVEEYFRSIGVKLPRLRICSVGGAANAPMPRAALARSLRRLNRVGARANEMGRLDPSLLSWAQETFEATVDVEIAGALAPGATFDLIFANADAAGFYEAIYAAIGLGGPGGRRADVVSISWGASESVWAGHLDSIDQALRAAALAGVTVLGSSGDFGSLNARGARVAGVNFPASSPHVLAVGGTQLSSGREVVWNERALGLHVASGGGLSGHWRRPSFQRRLSLSLPERSTTVWVDPSQPGPRQARGVPDVAASAARSGGYRVQVGGFATSAGGTSCATPLWAALIARCNEALGRSLGWVTPLLYRPQLRVGFRDIIQGSNRIGRGRAKAFRAHEGWDPCTGLGAPDGVALLDCFRRISRRGRTTGAGRGIPGS